MQTLRLVSQTLAGVVLSAALLGPAAATPFAEIPDAGSTTLSANDATGVAGLSFINGALSNELADGPDWVDLFRVSLAGGGTITANTGPGTDLSLVADPVLFVFNATGQGVLMNDESGGFGQAALGANGMVGSFYFLAVAFAGLEPLDTSGNPIFDVFGTQGLLSNLPLATWTGSPLALDPAIAGRYAIAVTNVPEASTWAQLALGLAGLAALSRTRRRG